MSRPWNKTFDTFVTAMKLAKTGKTFIIVSSDFVAIDMRTWDKINAERRLPYVFVDEGDLIDKGKLKEVENELKKMG